DMLRGIDEKLDRAPLGPWSLERIEAQITSLAERLSHQSDASLQTILDEATSRFHNLRSDAADIAEKAAKAALQDLQGTHPGAVDLDALKQGFVELKALQIRAEKATQETLRAVHGSLEALMARFTDQETATRRSDSISHALRDMPGEQMLP